VKLAGRPRAHSKLLSLFDPAFSMEQAALAALDKALSLLLETVVKEIEAGKRLTTENLLSVLAASNWELLRQIGQVGEEIGSVRGEIAQVRGELAREHERIDDLQKVLAGMQASFAKRLDETNKRIDALQKTLSRRDEQTHRRLAEGPDRYSGCV
jgi:chromosome segregation ATPase